MKHPFRSNYLAVTAVLAIAVAMFVINLLTPYLADDYSNLPITVWGSGEPLSDLGGMVRSMWHFYNNWGGRVEGSVFATLLLSVPPVIADLLNTLCYLLATLFIYLICKPNRGNSLPLYLCIHALVWICVPDYGQVMFWICGAANYLWTSVIVLSLLFMYHRYAVSGGTLYTKKSACILTFPLGFFAGLAMENMSAGMLVILTLQLVSFYRHHKKIQPAMITAYFGSLLGFAVLILAPGNRVRSEAEIELSLLFKFFIICYYWVFFAGILTVLWLVLYMLAKKILPGAGKEAVCESLSYLCGAAASAYCMLAAPSSPERTWYIVCVYALIAAGILYSLLEPRQTPAVKSAVCITTSCLMAFLLVSMADTCISSYEISVQTKAREAYILEQKQQGCLKIHTPVITHRYPLRARHDALTGLSDITSDPDFWINRAVANYYGVASITGTSP